MTRSPLREGPDTFHVNERQDSQFRFEVRPDSYVPGADPAAYRRSLSLLTDDEEQARDHCRRLNEFADNTGFHWQDGTHFKRCSDGAVAIVKWDRFNPAHIIAIIDQNSWASIVASVSAGGEQDGRFYAALAFHGEVAREAD